MWAPGPWGVSGFLWIVPVIGMLLCLGFAFMMFRAMATRHGCMCMGGHQGTANDELAEARREIKTLREEIRLNSAAR